MERIKLSQWAKENGKTYKEAWSLIDRNEFPEKIEKTKSNRIFVLRDSETAVAIKQNISFATPVTSDLSETPIDDKKTSRASRRNRAATIQRTDPFYHIENGVDPFVSERNSSSGVDCISIKDTISLTQKAYYNFSDFRNIIDVMTEFSTNNIYFRGGTEKSREFCTKFFNSHNINLLGFQDKFFRELYRSSNVPIYRYDGEITKEDLNNLRKVYGGKNVSKALKTFILPIKYVILNPANIVAGGNISFASIDFYQRLTPYEIQRLRNPRTDEERMFYESLPSEIKNKINNGGIDQIIDVPLDPNYSFMIFNKKQDYEPMAVPLGWPVLKDLNWKAEMKAIDMAVARTTQRVVLLITMGFENKNGEYMVDPKILQATKELFDSESVGKVFIGDFTTKAEFIIPDIGNILDPKKYEQVNQDIKTGLNNILIGSDEKFANQSIKVKLFIQRLQQSREIFINEFLKPEIKRICKDMGFRKFPEPYFEDLDLKDEDTFNRLITRLTEIGVLTAEECFVAMETGRLPTGEESELNQAKYKKFRDKGYYEPLIGGGKNDQMEGRPAGSKSPQSKKKKVKPSKASFSLLKIKENMIGAAELFKDLKEKACEKYKVEKLSEEQEEIINLIGEQIIINEEPNNWNKSISKYLKNPNFKNEEKYNEVINISSEHQITDLLAGILHASKKE